MNSTLGKALGGASGGFTLASKTVVNWLRQKSRPYLFSNSLPPAIASAGIEVLNLLENEPERLAKLRHNTEFFRTGVKKIGLDVIPGSHPIVPVMIYDALKAIEIAGELLKMGVYVIAFKYPVVPQGKARIRTQISAGHTEEDLQYVLGCFAKLKHVYNL